MEKVQTKALALINERSAKAIKIHWQFSIAAARAKRNKHYTRVNSANEKYKDT